jgi:hypothetical protein
MIKSKEKLIILIILVFASLLLNFFVQKYYIKMISPSFVALRTFSSIRFVSPIKNPDDLLILDSHRNMTAAQAFRVAYKWAKSWNQESKWYGIIPFTSIERAFAIPLDDNNPSWFFRFGIPDENREIIIEVSNGRIVGVNETKIPEYIEPSLQEIEPLDKWVINDNWVMIDNTEVLYRYLQEKDNLLSKFPHMLIDYRLTMPKEYTRPIWILYNAQNLTKPLFIIDSITGEVYWGR